MFDGRVAVITGASRGLGAGMAEHFAGEGVRLGLCSRGAPALADSEAVLGAQLDVSDGAAVEAFAQAVIARFGRIDLWINNAGILDPIAPLRDIGSAQFARQLTVNVLGVVHGTQSFVRHVRGRQGGGVLVNISSGAARKPYSGWSAYCATKAAVDRLTECVAIEEADAGLRAHAVAPGVIDTDMQRAIRATSEERFPLRDKFVQMKRDESFSSPAWVARHLLDLAFGPDPGRWAVLERLPAEP